MSRTEAARLVRERWERLGIGKPEEFPHVFSSDVDNMLLGVADQGKANPRIDSLCGGDEGVSGTVEGHGSPVGMLANRSLDGYDAGSEYQFSPADSQISTPLYLLASEIVDIVEFSEQYRAEEEAAAEEGALIEASGYQDPVYERNGR